MFGRAHASPPASFAHGLQSTSPEPAYATYLLLPLLLLMPPTRCGIGARIAADDHSPQATRSSQRSGSTAPPGGSTRLPPVPSLPIQYVCVRSVM